MSFLLRTGRITPEMVVAELDEIQHMSIHLPDKLRYQIWKKKISLHLAGGREEEFMFYYPILKNRKFKKP